MEQLIEFITNHPLLSGGFVAVAAMLVWSEIARRGQGFAVVPPAEAVHMINRKDPVIVDVSAAPDFSRGHIRGAKHIPLSRFTRPDAELEKIAKRPVLVVCKSGNTAMQAAKALTRLGATEVAVLKGGMAQWVADQYPVSKR